MSFYFNSLSVVKFENFPKKISEKQSCNILGNLIFHITANNNPLPQPAITCSKLTIETLEQSVKYVQS